MTKHVSDLAHRTRATVSHDEKIDASTLPRSHPEVFRRDHSSANNALPHQAVRQSPVIETEVLIVGAGFGGVYLLHRMRDDLGLDCKILEAGTDLGGVWHWNSYPGCRLDSPIPVYEFSLPKIWKGWTWSCKYPNYVELRRYFDHVEEQLQIKKDVIFDSAVASSEWDEDSRTWTVKTSDGKTGKCKYLVLATGFSAKRHFPDWSGFETFEGVIHHSSFWPEEGIDLKSLKVGIIGTGSTGIQFAQEAAKTAKDVTLFQRTPNLCLPMRQSSLTSEEQDERKGDYKEFFRHRKTTFTGFPYEYIPRNTAEDTPEERERVFEDLWAEGGFKFWLGTYKDVIFNKEANRHHYDFWAKKVRARIDDPKTADIFAPLEPLHAFGTKRPSLEQDFYEQFNKPNAHVVSVRNNPIVEVVPQGLKTTDGTVHEIDLLAICTGFDSLTGGMKSMGLKDVNGIDLADKWALGTWTYLGMSCNGYPNMFFLYGAQGPTAFVNGPTCVEAQGEWIIDIILKAKRENIGRLEATREAEVEWRDKVAELSDRTLLPGTDSWYMGANIPGKPREQLNYTGGFPLYQAELRAVLDNGFRGFAVAQ